MSGKLGPIPLEIMFVLTMLVVQMPMSALEQLVRMGVLIAFAHLQPYTRRQQSRNTPEKQ
jgi:hypothetical protein